MLGPRLLESYRRAGGQPPFTTPGGFLGAPFEGYYWRLTDRAREIVAVAFCGIVRDEPARGALVGVAVHPHGLVDSTFTSAAAGDGDRFAVDVAEQLRATSTSLHAAPSDTTRLSLELDGSRRFPRRPLGALGLAQVVPGLAQYWQPVLLGSAARGELEVRGERITIDGASLYAERTWGSAFPQRWWWGQAGAFDDDVAVAFAGGPIRIAGTQVAPTAAVVRLGAQTIALAPPLAKARTAVGRGRWRVELRSARHRLRIEGSDPERTAVELPVPRSDSPGSEPRASQALAGLIRVEVRRGRRTVYKGESRLAGLERESAACA